MIWATLRPEFLAMVHLRVEKPIIIQGLRDAGGPAAGEPVHLMLDAAEAKIVIAGLQDALVKLEGRKVS
jgi:hypothetical protein